MAVFSPLTGLYLELRKHVFKYRAIQNSDLSSLGKDSLLEAESPISK